MRYTATRPGLDNLVARLRDEIQRPGDAQLTASRVADVLRTAPPHLSILTPAERTGHADHYVSTLLHAEPGLSITALVWRPGQVTPIHDHIAWCAFTVVQGVEFETLYQDAGDHLVEIGSNANPTGSVSAFAPPGDIHRVHNVGRTIAVSLHVYGADLRDRTSSVRRIYDLPVRSADRAAG
jgi:predicted metal-dependent enzyme (double-stranded beta helix superfamily)